MGLKGFLAFAAIYFFILAAFIVDLIIKVASQYVYVLIAFLAAVWLAKKVITKGIKTKALKTILPKIKMI